MNYIRKLSNLITKKGKKTIAVKTVNFSLEKLRKRIPPSRLERLFEKLAPAVKIYKKKVAGKVYQIPAVIKKERSLFQAAKWLLLSLSSEKKGGNLSLKLTKVLFEMARKRGIVWKLRKQYLAVIKENRSYMRFIKKKRVKKKIWLFQQKFTKKTLTREMTENSLADPYDLKKVNSGRNIESQIKGYGKNKKINAKIKK